MTYWLSQLALYASLSIASTSSSQSSMMVLAFSATSPPISTAKRTRLRPASSSILQYQAGADVYATRQETETIATTTETLHIDDSNQRSILHNPTTNNLPVLIDCYAPQCGPCKLIEQSLASTLPKYDDQLRFCKWNAEDKETSADFMNLLRQHEMTFRVLPTLLLFVDGKPVAMRSGMASAGQIERFLMENLPVVGDKEEEECVDEVDLQGDMFLCDE